MRSARWGMLALTAAVGLAASGCGQTVKSLSIHDPLIPIESRRHLADAEDAVIVARAWYEQAEEDLDEVKRWRSNTAGAVPWPTNAAASGAAAKMMMMADARVELADLNRDRQQGEYDLARAKLKLITAETAMRHDLSVYDLDPIRAEVNEIRDRVKNLNEGYEAQRRKLSKLTAEWWVAYAAFVRATGGKQNVLWSVE